MPFNAIQKCIALDREAVFQDGHADFDVPSVNGGILFMVAEDFTGVQQAQIANRNYKKRPAAEHPMELALKSESEGSIEIYQYGASANVAEGAQALGLLRDEPILGALSGEVLGFSAGIAAGTDALPTIEEGDLDTQDTYAWGFWTDTSTPTNNRFRKFSTITDGGMGSPDTVNLLPGHNLLFTPDAGGADIMIATVGHFPLWSSMEDHTDANHFTHSMFRKGRDPEDSVEPRGVKFGLGQLVVTAGEQPSLVIPWKAADHVNLEDITQPSLTGSPSGIPGKTVGAGTESIVEIEDVGTDLGTNPERFWGTVTTDFAVTYKRYDGPNGREGVHGWGVDEASYEAQTIELMIEFDDDWWTDYHAGTRKHMLIQIGTGLTNTWAVYFPNLSWMDNGPQLAEHEGRRAVRMKFKCLEDDQIDISSLSEPVSSRAKAKFELLRVG